MSTDYSKVHKPSMEGIDGWNRDEHEKGTDQYMHRWIGMIIDRLIKI